MNKNDDRVYITHNDFEQLVELLTQSRDCFAISAKFICDFLSESKATESHQTIYSYVKAFFEKEEQLNQQLGRLGINAGSEKHFEPHNEQQNE